MSGPPAEPGTQALAESLAALAAQLADLRGQVAQVNQRLDRAGLRGDLDSGYELRDCWAGHIHAVWELSTLAAAWQYAYGGPRPDLGRALEFYDR